MTRSRLPIDWPHTIRAIGEETINCYILSARVQCTYAQAYERIRQLRSAELVETLRRGGSGQPAIYRLRVTVERAISVMAPAGEEAQHYDPTALEIAWPYDPAVYAYREEEKCVL